MPKTNATSRRALLAAPVALLATGLQAATTDDGWNQADLIQPKDLADKLAKGSKVKAIHVGFTALWKNRRIPGSVYAGPGREPQGIEALKKAVASMPKDAEIVLYCGCCPWDHCPNMKPAFATLKQLGFTKAKAMIIETNLSVDWIQKGYPTDSTPL